MKFSTADIFLLLYFITLFTVFYSILSSPFYYTIHIAYEMARWLGHILRHDSLLRITLEGQIQRKKTYGRPRTMLLDWPPRTGLDGVNEDGNLPYGRALQRDCISVNLSTLCHSQRALILYIRRRFINHLLTYLLKQLVI